MEWQYSESVCDNLGASCGMSEMLARVFKNYLRDAHSRIYCPDIVNQHKLYSCSHWIHSSPRDINVLASFDLCGARSCANCGGVKIIPSQTTPVPLYKAVIGPTPSHHPEKAVPERYPFFLLLLISQLNYSH